MHATRIMASARLFLSLVWLTVQSVQSIGLHNLRRNHSDHSKVNYSDTGNAFRHSKPQYLILKTIPIQGLANRLRILAAYIYIREEHHRNSIILVYWESFDNCPAHYLDVFEPLPYVKFIDMNQLAVHDAEGLQINTSNTTFRHLVSATVGTEPARVFVLEGSIYLNKIVPKKFIRDAVHSFKTVHCNYAAIHVRRTDIYGYRPNATTDQEFFDFIDKLPKNQSIFLMTDNRDTQDHFIAKYGDRILVNRMITRYDSVPRNNVPLRHTSVADAVTDAYIAAHSAVFLGTAGSSFSHYVAVLHYFLKSRQRSCDQ